MLKITAPTALARPSFIRTNKNPLDTNTGSDIDSGKINDKIVNLSNSTKKMSSEADFFIFKTGLSFIN